MGDLSVEPSMEEILSSIKRIIAEEGDGSQPRTRRAPRAAPAPVVDAYDDDDDSEVLELSDPIPEPIARAEPAPAPRVPPHLQPVKAPKAAAPAPVPSIPQQEPEALAPKPAMTSQQPESILSQQTAAASLGALETLSKLITKPDANGDGTLEGLVREMLRPMLRDWLDAHLPDMVETIVAREIAKLTAQVR
jgi:cell pole-organizing protein PopZ